MYTNVNLAAPIGVLMFLGTSLFVCVIALTLIYSLLTRRLFLANLTVMALLLAGVAYVSVILLFSFTSRSQELAQGQEKHFCEIDCHLAYSIVSVKQAKTIGAGPNLLNTNGIFYVVTVKTRFDQTTISPTRGNGPLSPNSRAITIKDANGAQYYPLPQFGLVNAGTPITTPLRPGESYTTMFVFDLPTNINNPTLLISENDWINHLIIGNENSLAHKKTSLQL